MPPPDLWLATWRIPALAVWVGFRHLAQGILVQLDELEKGKDAQLPCAPVVVAWQAFCWQVVLQDMLIFEKHIRCRRRKRFANGVPGMVSGAVLIVRVSL